MKPTRIGFSACFFHPDPQRPIFKGKTLLYLEQSIARWVMARGALAYMIPAPAPEGPVDLAALARPLDGLVLQGGSDLSPLSYGEQPLKAEWAGDALRDAYEIALVRAFREQGKPVLGVCRGLQLLNVAFGGSLHQDIARQAQAKAEIQHRDWERYDQNTHALRLSGHLAALAGTTQARVNSVHHQGVKELGKGLLVEAESQPDGLVEAFRAKEGPHLFAVQWHPEFQDPGDHALLDSSGFLGEFLAAAGQGGGHV